MVVASSNVALLACTIGRVCVLNMKCMSMKRRLLPHFLSAKYKMTVQYIWISRVDLQVGL